MYNILKNKLSNNLQDRLQLRLDTNHDPLNIFQYVDNILQHVVSILPQKTLTNKHIPNIIKIIDQKCTKKIFRGGNPNVPNLPHPNDYSTNQYVDNPVFTNTSTINFLENIARSSLTMYGGGNKQDSLIIIAKYISSYMKKYNKSTEKNAKYQLASYIYMKIHCLATKSNSSNKLLTF